MKVNGFVILYIKILNQLL